jgi:hypothetical protein
MMPHGVRGASTNSFHLPRWTASLLISRISLSLRCLRCEIRPEFPRPIDFL